MSAFTFVGMEVLPRGALIPDVTGDGIPDFIVVDSKITKSHGADDKFVCGQNYIASIIAGKYNKDGKIVPSSDQTVLHKYDGCGMGRLANWEVADYNGDGKPDIRLVEHINETSCDCPRDSLNCAQYDSNKISTHTYIFFNYSLSQK